MPSVKKDSVKMMRASHTLLKNRHVGVERAGLVKERLKSQALREGISLPLL